MAFHKIVAEDLQNIAAQPIHWEKLREKTVLITGVNGMIATYLAYILLYLNDTKQMGIHVLGLARGEQKTRERFGDLLDRADFDLLIQDVTKPIFYDGPVDFVIHAASQTGPIQFTEDPVGTIAAGAMGTDHLLSFAVQKQAEGFLFLSTREIYGKNEEGKEFVKEDEYGVLDPTLVRSCYPESKRIAETLCAAYRKQYGLNGKIARIAHTYGPGILIGDGRVVGDFLNNVLHNEDIVMNSDGSAVLALTYLSDTVAGLFYVLLNFEGFVYNISSDKEAISVRTLAQKLCELFPEKNIKAVFQPADPSKKAGYLAHTVALLSSEKAERDGWMPMVSVCDGMRRTVEFIESVAL